MDALVLVVVLSPLLAAVLIGGGVLCGKLQGEASEAMTARIANGAITLSFFMVSLLWLLNGLNKTTGTFELSPWLSSETLEIRFSFVTQGFQLNLAAVFALLLAVVMQFSHNYFHREVSFHRFFFMLSLFSFAILLFVLSGNTVSTLMGWVLAGLCSYLGIGHFYQRSTATTNALRAIVTKHISDACFTVGIGLCFAWIGSLNWHDINTRFIDLPHSQITGIALCFAFASIIKSAQLPFTPWLARAMEGPTPSSAVFYGAVMIHSGVFLLCLLQPLFESTALVMVLLIIVGFLTAVYSFFVGLTQTDVKSSWVYAVTAQLGLMFLECGLGFWTLVHWHIAAHAIVRTYQLLTAPNFIHALHDNPVKTVSPKLANLRWLYTASLQRFWLEQLSDWAVVKPIRRLAHDLCFVDDYLIDRFLGAPNPALQTVSSLAQLEEAKLGARLDGNTDEFAQGSGLAGKLTQWMADLSHWFEHHFILQGVGKHSIQYGRELGHILNKVERLLLRPRYLVLFVFLTLLTVF